jgi:hypothetical protein
VLLGPKCNTATCLQPIAARVHWPSGPIRCCATCLAGWRRVAEAMGLHLVVEQILYQAPGVNDAEQRFALLALT